MLSDYVVPIEKERQWRQCKRHRKYSACIGWLGRMHKCVPEWLSTTCATHTLHCALSCRMFAERRAIRRTAVVVCPRTLESAANWILSNAFAKYIHTQTRHALCTTKQNIRLANKQNTSPNERHETAGQNRRNEEDGAKKRARKTITLNE